MALQMGSFARGRTYIRSPLSSFKVSEIKVEKIKSAQFIGGYFCNIFNYKVILMNYFLGR